MLPTTQPAAPAQARRSERVLDPIARSLRSAVRPDHGADVHGTLVPPRPDGKRFGYCSSAMIGCNMAWGLVDAVMFLMSSLTERGHSLLTIRASPRSRQR